MHCQGGVCGQNRFSERDRTRILSLEKVCRILEANSGLRSCGPSKKGHIWGAHFHRAPHFDRVVARLSPPLVQGPSYPLETPPMPF